MASLEPDQPLILPSSAKRQPPPLPQGPVVDGGLEHEDIFSRLRRIQASSLIDRDGRRAALNLMEDAVAARQAVERENLERQRAETLLAEREEEYRASFETTAVGKFHANPQNLKILRANIACCQMLAYDEAEFLAKTIWDLLHPQDVRIFRENYERMLSGEIDDLRLVSRYLRQDRTVMWGDLSINLVRDAQGGPLRIIAVIQDISARVESTERLRLAANRDAFRVTLTDALRPLKAPHEVQAVACQVLGKFLNASRVIYADLQEETYRIQPNGYADEVPEISGSLPAKSFGEELQRQFLAGNTVVVNDIVEQELTPEKRQAFLQISIRAHLSVPIAKLPLHVSLISVHQSVPRNWTAEEIALVEETAERTWAAVEQAHAELALRHSEEQLRELNTFLDQRVQEQTQELREREARLQALAMELTRAEQQERKKLSRVLHDEVQQYLVGAKLRVGMARNERVSRNASQQMQLVSDLLDEAINATRDLARELSPPVLHIQGLSAALHWFAERVQKQYGLELTIKSELEIEPQSESLRDVLFQIARELILNVVKHSGVHAASITLQQVENQLEMTVCDQGQGFDPLNQKHYENSFGLLHIQERLKPLSGFLSLESAPQEGTTARVLLPAEIAVLPKKALIAHAISPDKPREENRLNILLVDDHQIIREGISRLILGQWDLEVIGEASNGEEAILLAHRLHPDVIVMDINMPGMNGIEATRRIKDELPSIRIIGLSLHRIEDMAQAMLDAGAETYLAKDGPVQNLLTAIRSKTAHF
jgi:PAS domain S-box-containing protein